MTLQVGVGGAVPSYLSRSTALRPPCGRGCCRTASHRRRTRSRWCATSAAERASLPVTHKHNTAQTRVCVCVYDKSHTPHGNTLNRLQTAAGYQRGDFIAEQHFTQSVDGVETRKVSADRRTVKQLNRCVQVCTFSPP